MADNIVIRKGKADDAEDFSHLFLLSLLNLSVFLFGPNAREVAKRLFQQTGNIFSFEHSYFIELNAKIAGTVSGYSWEENKTEGLHTGRLLFKYMKWSFFSRISRLLKAYKTWNIRENEYYICILAVYPEFRRLGLATRLLLEIEQAAKKVSSTSVLDVYANNEGAIKLYEKLGYKIETPAYGITTSGDVSESFRMYKTLK